MDYVYRYESPLGSMTMASDGNALTGLWFDGQKYDAATLSACRMEQYLPVFGETVRWLDIYFSGRVPDFTPALSLSATPFRRAVWVILMTVPYGHTVTYGDIARRYAGQAGTDRVSARAVGGAVGHNPVSLIIPCHRVVGAGGRLTGYAAGLDRKIRLLRMEQADGYGG